MSVEYLEKRGQWNSRLGFLLAAIGSAIGLGNIWRFSYMAYDNGGGAFLIPYVVALLTTGIPLLILEFGIGHERNGSAPVACARINRRWEWLGWWAVTFVMFGIVLYYVVIIAWCLDYVFLSFTLPWGNDPNTYFFKSFLGLSESPSSMGGIRPHIIFGVAVIWFLNWLIVDKGVESGIEKANKIFMPLLLVLTAFLVFWSLTLEGAKEGITAYLKPDFSILAKPKVWIDAYSQIFFTLSLGFGIMIAYASYLPEKTNITGNAVITAVVNCGFSIFSGFGVFAILGYMAHSTGQPIGEVVAQSIGLAFVAYPKAISLLPFMGKLFGVLFFASLVVAGLSSSISILEAFTAAILDKFQLDRKRTVTVICCIGFLGSLIFTTGSGLFWLDIVDHFLTSYGLIMIGLLECVLVGWLFRIDILKKHINRISEWKLGGWWDFLIKFFIPLVLIIIVAINLYKEVSKPYEGYTWSALIIIGVGWLVVTLIGALVLTFKAWRVDIFKHHPRMSLNNNKS